MAWTNPVTGRIQAKTETWDRVSYRVTATHADHNARVPPVNGMDIGNGRQGGDVYAVERGTVSQTYKDLGNGALIVRIDHGNLLNGQKTVTGYAHVATFAVKTGQIVARGQKIATVGMTGATAPHLHLGLTVGGVAKDPWPYLNANQEVPDDVKEIITIYPGLRDCATKGGALTGYRFSPAPTTKSGSFAAGSGFHSDQEYARTPTPDGWPAGPYQRVVDGFFEGYLLANSQITVGPMPQPGTGGDTAKAYNEGLAAAEAAVKAVPER